MATPGAAELKSAKSLKRKPFSRPRRASKKGDQRLRLLDGAHPAADQIAPPPVGPGGGALLEPGGELHHVCPSLHPAGRAERQPQRQARFAEGHIRLLCV